MAFAVMFKLKLKWFWF